MKTYIQSLVLLLIILAFPSLINFLFIIWGYGKLDSDAFGFTMAGCLCLLPVCAVPFFK